MTCLTVNKIVIWHFLYWSWSEPAIVLRNVWPSNVFLQPTATSITTTWHILLRLRATSWYHSASLRKVCVAPSGGTFSHSLWPGIMPFVIFSETVWGNDARQRIYNVFFILFHNCQFCNLCVSINVCTEGHLCDYWKTFAIHRSSSVRLEPEANIDWIARLFIIYMSWQFCRCLIKKICQNNFDHVVVELV